MAPTVPVSAAQDTINSTAVHDGSNKTLVISLTAVLSAVFVSLAAIFICCCCRRRRRGPRGPRGGLFRRNVSPIDDDEIESWKTSRSNEKAAAVSETADTTSLSETDGVGANFAYDPALTSESSPATAPAGHCSSRSLRKPPTLIVYQNFRASEDNCSPSTMSMSPPLCSAPTWTPHAPKQSVDLPQTPVLARAPNSRPGLTDDAIQGDEPYIAPVPSPRRQSSRICKQPPRSPRHHRSRSSRSSTSVGSLHQWYGHLSYGSSAPMIPGADYGKRASSPASPRSSIDHLFNFNQPSSPAYPYPRRRGYSVSSSHPLRLSLDTDYMDNMSPRPSVRTEEIGKAIG